MGKVSDNKEHRVEDDEVLFVSLILMFGEPPTSPLYHSSLEARLKYVHANKSYALDIKTMMEELGHSPHMGLYVAYMHWCKEQWHG